jgi:hypothetical protein
MSGNEIARFASFSNLTAVAWMRNGAVAFGKTPSLLFTQKGGRAKLTH